MIKAINCKRLDGNVSYLKSLEDVPWRLGGTHSQEPGYNLSLTQARKVYTKDYTFVVNLESNPLSQCFSMMRVRRKTHSIEMGNENYFDEFDKTKLASEQFALGQQAARNYIAKCVPFLEYMGLFGMMGREIIMQGAYIKLKHNYKRRNFNEGWNDVVSAYCRTHGFSWSFHIYEADLKNPLSYSYLTGAIMSDYIDIPFHITECGAIPVRPDNPQGVPVERYYEISERVWRDLAEILVDEDKVKMFVQVSHNDDFAVGLYHNGLPTPNFNTFTSI